MFGVFMIYNEIYYGNDIELSKNINYLKIIKELNFCKENKEEFILISSDIVFDRSLNKVYSEDSETNCINIDGKFLCQSEKLVLNYEKGYVIRVQDNFDLYRDLIKKMICHNCIPIFNGSKFYFMSNRLINFYIHTICKNLYYKIYHLSSNLFFEDSFLWFILKNSIFEKDKSFSTFSYNQYGCLSSRITNNNSILLIDYNYIKKNIEEIKKCQNNY